MDRSEPIAPTITRLPARPGRSGSDAARTLGWPLALSLALHGVVALLLALLVSSGGGAVFPSSSTPLQATLTTPEQRFVVPQPEALPPPASERSFHDAAQPSVLPVPMKPRAVPAEKRTPRGEATIEVLAVYEPVDAAVVALIQQLYPGAVRSVAQFEVFPPSVYPDAALATKRQLQMQVVAIVHEDGRVELAQGTLDDPVWAPAIRASLAAAKAVPLAIDGQPRSSYVLLMFTFEYVGDR